jgi:hypothetical protein
MDNNTAGVIVMLALIAAFCFVLWLSSRHPK